MLRRYLLVAIAAGLLGGIAGFATGIFVYPFWFLNDVAMETVADRAAKTAVAGGTFIHPDPNDPVHWGRGTVSVLAGRDSRVVHLGADFAVGPGPRFHVYLADRADVQSAADFRAAAMTDLGRLRAFQGSQVYDIPAGVDLARAKSVVIWCKEFGVLISPATLKPADAAPSA
ncbi:MAG: DM13 domain-containing protein [Rhodospirillales bacterium]